MDMEWNCSDLTIPVDYLLVSTIQANNFITEIGVN